LPEPKFARRHSEDNCQEDICLDDCCPRVKLAMGEIRLDDMFARIQKNVPPEKKFQVNVLRANFFRANTFWAKIMVQKLFVFVAKNLPEFTQKQIF
jgi:hypothetical protein